MKKGISLPRSIEFCHKRIKKLEEELVNEKDGREVDNHASALALAWKDKEMLVMCRHCQRGRR